MKEPARIRIVLAEDETMLATVLEQFLVSRGHSVIVVHDGRAALDAIRHTPCDVALLDISMPEMDGLEVLRHLQEEPAPPQVIIITGNGTIETAITAIRLGAYDYLSKPYRMAEIDALVRRAWEKGRLAHENAVLHRRLDRARSEPEVIGQTPIMREILGIAERAAPSDAPVLITGESGTGKELFARLIHRLSGRGGGTQSSFVDVDCAAIAGPGMEQDLFGHEKGAFAGAAARASGLVELAAGGTLFLDEVADLDVKTEGKLLKAIETRSFMRVGGTHAVDFDVRVIAATRHDLTAPVADRTIRSDFLHRIATVTIALPPLQGRVDDIPLLAEHFLRLFGGVAAPTLTDDAFAALKAYRWPGNVRELRNVIERIVLLTPPGTIVTGSDLPLGGPARSGSAEDPEVRPVSLAELERRHIQLVLARTSWHQGRAAEQLGISSKTLYRKIREYGFARPRAANAR